MNLRLAAVALVAVTPLLVGGCSEDEEPTVADFCAQLRDVRDLDEVLAHLDQEQLGGAVSDLEALADAAPKEIRADVEELLAGVTAVVDVVTTAEGDPADAAEAALRAEADRMGQVERAGQRLEAFAQERCAIDLVATTSTSAPAVPAAPPTSVSGLD